MYSLTAFDPLHNFYQGISKLLKAAGSHLEGEKLTAAKGGRANSFQGSRWSKRIVPSEYNALSRCIKEDCNIVRVRVDLSEKNTFIKVSGLFTGTWIRRVLEEKQYRIVDGVFPFCGRVHLLSYRIFKEGTDDGGTFRVLSGN